MMFTVTIHDGPSPDQLDNIVRQYDMQVADMREAQEHLQESREVWAEYWVHADFGFFEQSFSHRYKDQVKAELGDTPPAQEPDSIKLVGADVVHTDSDSLLNVLGYALNPFPDRPLPRHEDPDDERDRQLENDERDFEDRMNAYFEGRHEDL